MKAVWLVPLKIVMLPYVCICYLFGNSFLRTWEEIVTYFVYADIKELREEE